MQDEVLTGVHILVVDDNAHLLHAASRLLEKAGYEVLNAATGEEALRVARRVKPDLMLLDVVLPDMDGLEIAQRIKRDTALVDTYVILLSSVKISLDERTEALETVADDYIVRPIPNRELLARVRAMLRIQRAERALREANAALEQRVATRTAELDQANQALRAEVAARQRVEDALRENAEVLRRLVRGTASATGPVFFETLVEELADWLGVRWALVGEISPDAPERVRPLAFWCDSCLKDLEAYDLVGTPCERVQKRDFCVFSSDVVDLFPTDRMLRNLGVVWYAGIPLRDKAEGHAREGKAVGILCAMHDQVIEPPENIAEIFSIFSHRAGAEVIRRQMEDALRESEHKYRELVENANSIIFRMDTEGRVTFLNEFAQRFFGYTEDEILGQPAVGTVVPEKGRHGEDLATMIQDLLHHPDRYPTNENENVRSDGTRVWVAWTNKAIRDAEGRLTGVLCVGNDITARKHIEAALRESERKFRAISNSAQDAILMMDDAGRITFWNDAAERIFGYTRREAMGQVLHELLAPPHYHTAYHEGLTRYRDSGQGCVLGRTLEMTALRKNGEEFPIELSISAIALQGTWHAVGIVRDITRRMQVEDEMRKLSRAVEQSPSTVVITDPEGNIEYVNPKFTQLTGYAPEEVIGENPRLLKSGDHLPEFYEVFWATLTSGGEWRGEFHNQRKNGELYWERAAISSIRGPDGEIQYYVKVGEDMTERKQMEAELKRSNAELQQFAYVISHDLQEPLRMVNGFLTLLAKRYEGQLDDKAQQYIAFAVDGAERMQKMIKALLEYARVNTRGQALVPVDVEDVLARVLHNMRFRIDESQAEITYDALPAVMADSVQLEQVFQNLVGNALKFHDDAPPRIHIAAECGVDAEGREVTVAPEPEVTMMCRFSVRDEGIGIAPEHTEEIFRVFRRLHTRDEYEGTGIGLAICKRIVERHGGRIWVVSELGEGSTFFFTLPMITTISDVDVTTVGASV
jgi:PAS domain S-box-containing protein